MSQDILVVEYEPRYTERVRQALLPFGGDVSLGLVVKAFSEHVYHPDVWGYSPNLFLEMSLLLCETGNVEEAKEVIHRGRREMQFWPDRVQTRIGSLDDWESQGLAAVSSPVSVRRTVSEEIVKHKLEEVAFRELLP